ncbi:hypothetical protein DL93DRAFT_2073011 [Clavulina sp. PMI_390]|nr:hypothetical protein DL93DRAFT_2073011 [Clavulina sp. PMI_390]
MSSSYSTASYSESTQSLVSTKAQSKDYSRALAELSTQYGFGVAPALPTSTATTAPSTSSFSSKITKAAAVNPLPQSASPKAKDFPRAVADLQMSYGFQGAPVLPSFSR